MDSLKKSSTRNYTYLLSLLGPVFTIAGNYYGGWWVASNTIFYLLIMNAIEHFAPTNTKNKEGNSTFIPHFILLTHVLFQLIAITTFLYMIVRDDPNWYVFLFACLSMGINTGTSAIVIAHELIHKKQSFWRYLGRLMLFTAANPYFYIDHIKVHHKHVGTDKDSASANRGESVYRFFERSAYGQIKSSFKIEKERLKNKSSIQQFIGNYVMRSIFLTFVFCISLFLVGGYLLVLAHLIQAYISAFLLEYINYIEHYGLKREEGKRVNETHSWQSDRIVSRFFLIDLSRHSDHHYYASKPFFKLNSHEGSPVLPGGYLSVFLLVMIPGLWFKKIHPILDKHRIS